jgi:hypothetical protein
MSNDVLQIECKNCEARYRVPPTMAGKKLTCKRCGKPIFVREAGATTKKRRTTTRRYTRVKGAQQPKKISPMMYLSGVACVVLVVGTIVVLLSR